MENPKKIITCRKCGQQLRFPANLHVRFACPTCDTRYEFDKGVEVETEPGNVAKVIPTQQMAVKKPVVKSGRRKTLLFLLGAAACVFFFWATCEHPNKSVHEFPIMPETTAYVPPNANSNPGSMPNITLAIPRSEEDIKDSLFDEGCKELAKELLKKTFEKLLDEIKEQAENGSWEKADEWYGRVTDILGKAGKRGRDLIKKYEGELAKLKTTIVSKNPSAGTMPGAEKTNSGESESNAAVAEIRNSTIYELTLYYSGTESRIVTIAPQGTAEITLPRGSYTVVARVSAPNVREYIGTENYGGYHYSSSFYIAHGFQ